MAAAESMLTHGDFIARFEAGLASLRGLDWPEARRRYAALCQSFAPLDPPGMRITDGRVNRVAVRSFLPTAARPGMVHGALPT